MEYEGQKRSRKKREKCRKAERKKRKIEFSWSVLRVLRHSIWKLGKCQAQRAYEQMLSRARSRPPRREKRSLEYADTNQRCRCYFHICEMQMQRQRGIGAAPNLRCARLHACTRVRATFERRACCFRGVCRVTRNEPLFPLSKKSLESPFNAVESRSVISQRPRASN